MPQHPLNILLNDFKKFFKQKYSPFFNKAQFSSREEAIGRLSLAIKAQDTTLREQYPCSDAQAEPQFDFAELVIGEVKKFTVLLLLSVIKFYEPCLQAAGDGGVTIDPGMLQDKLMSFVLKLIFSEGSSTLYRVCLSMCRFETISEEKTLATLITSQKSLQLSTEDCNIDPSFQLVAIDTKMAASAEMDSAVVTQSTNTRNATFSSPPKKPSATLRFHYD